MVAFARVIGEKFVFGRANVFFLLAEPDGSERKHMRMHVQLGFVVGVLFSYLFFTFFLPF